MAENHALKPQVDELIKCLEAEMLLSDHLLKLGEQQQKALVSSDKRLVGEIAAAQDARLAQLASVRKHSDAAVAALAKVLEMKGENPSLADLASAVGEPDSQRINEAAASLVDIATKLYTQNLVNSSLLTNAIQYVTFCLRLLSSEDHQVSYQAGSSGQVKANSLLLDQIA